MPVTVRTQPIDGEPWRKATTNDREKVLQKGWEDEDDLLEDTKLMESSLDDTTSPKVTPSPNGLVDAAIEAWNTHHHLVLRPDDIWLSIISQLSFFINANAEALRSFFVSHQGQKTLNVSQAGHPDSGVDYGLFAQQMSAELSNHVNDPALVPWLLPSFSTTTSTDRIVGSVLLMGAMQQYFYYRFSCIICGIPSITLLGSRADWVDLADRIDKIKSLGGEAVEFHSLLMPIARHMVLTFDEPTSERVFTFWRAIASIETPKYSMCGGPERLVSGWINTFCFWKASGKRNDFAVGDSPPLVIDGVRYQPLQPEKKVVGWASVPVTVRWVDGEVVVEERKCRMVAGSVGMRPGRHADLGVRLEGLPLPMREGEEDESGEIERENEKTGVFEKEPDSELTGTMGFAEPGRKTAYDWSDGESDDQEELSDDREDTNLETTKERVERWVQVETKRQPGSPHVRDGFDAVQPHVGWWIFEEKGAEKD